MFSKIISIQFDDIRVLRIYWIYSDIVLIYYLQLG